METELVVLSVLQGANLLIYRWVGKVFLSQPRFNHPSIFHNATVASALLYGPMVMMAILVILAFFVTESPWLFLALTIAGFIAFSSRPNSDFLG